MLFPFLWVGIPFFSRKIWMISAVLFSSLLKEGVSINFFSKSNASSKSAGEGKSMPFSVQIVPVLFNCCS